jgi:DNA-directed RNA polymerase specialized sigma24 family protein
LSKAGELDDDFEVEHTFEDWYEEAKKCLMDADPLVRDVTLLKLEGYGQREVSGRLGIKRKQFYDLWTQGKELLIKGMGH